MSLKLCFLHSHLDFFFSLKTRQPFPMNMVKVSINIVHKFKGGTVENLVQIFWLIAAGVL